LAPTDEISLGPIEQRTMQRREFLRMAGAATVIAAAGQSAQAATTERAVTVRRNDSDRFLLDFAPSEPRPLRILQLTDTHFGNPDIGSKVQDRRSFLEIRRLVEEQRPDFLVHTGDFINNDRGAKISFEAIEVFDDLGVPWTHTLGNHDVGHRSVEEFRRPMKNAAVGEFRAGDETEYAFRFDIVAAGQTDPRFTLFCFDSGFKEPNRKVSRGQLDWFARQMRKDTHDGLATPCLAMIHIPVLEFETLRAANLHRGHVGERVCFDSDTGDTFAAFKNSGRVRGVFSGHDHQNDYSGHWQGIELVYGRVGGWSAYGDLQRGGRLIEIDLANGTYKHQVVVPAKRDA
jgi:3',5'-cyclic AMP phosphodiesterase CpdA